MGRSNSMGCSYTGIDSIVDQRNAYGSKEDVLNFAIYMVGWAFLCQYMSTYVTSNAFFFLKRILKVCIDFY